MSEAQVATGSDAGDAVAVSACRGCGASSLVAVVDLGEQPACDHFPPVGEGVPDPTWPLGLVLCPECGLSQLSHDSPAPEEPLAVESATLKRHAVEVSGRLVDRLNLEPGTRVREFASHHGGSWTDALCAAGLTVLGASSRENSDDDARRERGAATADDERVLSVADRERDATAEDDERDAVLADVVIDNMSIIHAEDLQAELAERVAALAPGGRLVIEFHHALPQVTQGQFDSIRHGHPLYFSLGSWRAAVQRFGLEVETAWPEDVFGGCLVVVARAGAEPDEAARAVLAAEAEAGLATPEGYAPLARRAREAGAGLRELLQSEVAAGRRVAAYGAGSKGVVFLNAAGVDADLLPMTADLSPAKHGRRIPGTSIPIVSPDDLVAAVPDTVVILTWDIAREVVTDLTTRGLTHTTWWVAQPVLEQVRFP
ncbi:MAG: class I SAM-dependent methyltransferase [Dermatophilus congolensis]|nr:class I SAM-dependent methyltransferase [Dermatophilus congolensis]